ncbi:MAG: ribonuclease HI [Proteobacteria bacterium]|nr:ribonuclease HI [Pseudomonadota bacterium]
MNQNIVKMYTDGACSGNPGPGGWGVVLLYGMQQKTLNGAEANTTNNRMELMAAIEGLKALKRSCHVEVTTDSEYVKKGITEWMKSWKLKNWRTANNKPVKNQDLWQALDEEIKRHHVTWHWVKGHSGHPENEKADTLAREAILTLNHKGIK